MKIGFLLYPTAKVKTDEDTSFWIMHELQKRGHEVFYFESQGLFWREGSCRAFLIPAKLHPKKGFLPSPAASKAADLGRMSCIFVRKEPPFDNEYLYALQLLERLRRDVFILNDPRGIALCNEKLSTLAFKKFIPETLVTGDPTIARNFINDLGKKVVVKPLDNKGGAGIFSTHPGDENLPSLLDMATHSGRKRVLVQRFVDPARLGDKRILMLNGKILGVFLRKPPRGDFRANLGVGGSMHRAVVSASDKRLAEAVAPFLLRHGLYFVGLDVIGRYLVEMNVTSPSGIPELNVLNKVRLEKAVADFIEERL